ncbi:A/G-specific adenine glycosylase, partial [Streptomyces spiralis]
MTAPTLPPHSPTTPATPATDADADAVTDDCAVDATTTGDAPATASGTSGAPHGAPLHTHVITWFDANARDLPWRRADAGAWGVMVSEFMLQQTPVNRVLPVYEQWLERWPRPADLAKEAPGEAVRAW